MPFNPFSALTAKIFGGASVLLLIALALTYSWGSAGWRTADAYKTAHRLQKEAYISAQAAARDKAIAQTIRTENRYAELARKAEHAESQLDTALRDAAARFAAARRVRPEDAGRAPGGSAAPAQGDHAPDRDGPGADAVVLTRPEYDQFVSNSLRLERVRRWAETLIAEKLAIPEAEFGAEAASPAGGENQ